MTSEGEMTNTDDATAPVPRHARAAHRRAVVAHVRQELALSRQDGASWSHLERAHILSQPWAWPHTRVHLAMLRRALRDGDAREVAGQVLRVAVAGPGSLVGKYPAGNSGRASMRLTATADVPPDLHAILSGPSA